MSKRAKLLESIRKAGLHNVRFEDLVSLVKALGYTHSSTNGSHMVFTHATAPFVNLQKTGNGQAKGYQVRQVLDIIEANKLEVK